MEPRKKDRAQTPETITSPVQDDSNIRQKSEESPCPKSSVSKESDSSCQKRP